MNTWCAGQLLQWLRMMRASDKARLRTETEPPSDGLRWFCHRDGAPALELIVRRTQCPGAAHALKRSSCGPLVWPSTGRGSVLRTSTLRSCVRGRPRRVTVGGSTRSTRRRPLSPGTRTRRDGGTSRRARTGSRRMRLGRSGKGRCMSVFCSSPSRTTSASSSRSWLPAPRCAAPAGNGPRRTAWEAPKP